MDNNKWEMEKSRDIKLNVPIIYDPYLLILKINERYSISDEKEIERIYKAIEVVEELYKGEKRDDGDPAISHPLTVAYMMADIGYSLDAVIAGLLHDVLEDYSPSKENPNKEWTYEKIKKEFGERVANLVEALSKPRFTGTGWVFPKDPRYYTSLKKSPDKKQKEKRERTYYERLMIAPNASALVIKTRDLMHNAVTLAHIDEKKARRKIRQLIELLYPISRFDMKTMEQIIDIISFWQKEDPRLFSPELKKKFNEFKDSLREERKKLMGIRHMVFEQLPIPLLDIRTLPLPLSNYINVYVLEPQILASSVETIGEIKDKLPLGPEDVGFFEIGFPDIGKDIEKELEGISRNLLPALLDSEIPSIHIELPKRWDLKSGSLVNETVDIHEYVVRVYGIRSLLLENHIKLIAKRSKDKILYSVVASYISSSGKEVKENIGRREWVEAKNLKISLAKVRKIKNKEIAQRIEDGIRMTRLTYKVFLSEVVGLYYNKEVYTALKVKRSLKEYGLNEREALAAMEFINSIRKIRNEIPPPYNEMEEVITAEMAQRYKEAVQKIGNILLPNNPEVKAFTLKETIKDLEKEVKKASSSIIAKKRKIK